MKAIDKFKEYLEIERQRNIQMLEISRLLKVDFTFSEEELIANAEEKYVKAVEKELVKEVELWMKSAL
jgi:uncharacterized membrane protein affecting hemolysin expression